MISDDDREKLNNCKPIKRVTENTPLNVALKNRNIEIAEFLLSKPEVDVNFKSTETFYISGYSRYYFAIENGRKQFKLIFEDSVKQRESSELHNAVEKNDIEIVKLLLKHPTIDINDKFVFSSKGSQGKRIRESTPLITAIEKGYLDIVKLLIEQPNIDLDVKYNYLESFQKNGDYKTMIQKYNKEFYQGYKEDEEEDEDEYALYEQSTILCHAMKSFKFDVIEYLLTLPNIDVNALSIRGFRKRKTIMSALHVAISQGSLKYVKLLLEREDTDVNIPFIHTKKQKIIPLYMAIDSGNTEIVKFLLERPEIDINLTSFDNVLSFGDYNEQERAPIHIAAHRGNVDIINLLLVKSEIDVNIEEVDHQIIDSFIEDGQKFKLSQNIYDVKKQTALHIAIQNENWEIVQILLSRQEINVNIKYIDSIKADFDTQIEKTALNMAIEKENYKLVQLLLNIKDIDINAKSIKRDYFEKSEEKTALYEAIQKENIDIIKLLLAQKDININEIYVNEFYKENTLDRIEHNILYLAINTQNIDIVKLLLAQQKIEVNFVIKIVSKTVKKVFDLSTLSLLNLEFITETTKTVLIEAVEKKFINILKLLLENPEIDVNVVSKTTGYDVYQKRSKVYENDTALHIAVKNGSLEIIQLLLNNKNIELNIEDVEGRIPINCTNDADIKALFQQ